MRKGSRLQPLARAVLRSQSDERLVALSREGRDAAFEEIVRRYRPGLVAFAAAYAPPDRAEDVVQESFVSSWDALRRSTEEIRLKPWLYTIVRNRALNARRDARPQAPLSEEIDGVREPAEIVLTNEELARVVSAVGSLPEAQRQALVRSAIEGHTHEQIAASIGSSPGAVRQLIYRARLTVREGVGFLIPLPIVRTLVEAGSGEALAGGAVAGGTAVAGTAGGASALSKATVAAVVGTIAAASGVAIKRQADEDSRADSPTRAAMAGNGGSSGGAGLGASSPGAGSSGPSASSGPGSGQGDDGSDSSGPGPGGEGGDDRSGPGGGSGDDDDSSGPSASSGPGSGESEPLDDSSGPGSGDDAVEVEGESDNSGPGSGSSGSGSSGSGTSGSGSSGSGSSGSGSSGSGSDSSGSDSSGSGSSGSGTSGSGSSGSELDSSGSGSSGSELDSSGSGSSGSGSGD
jgi:RNA polymerase sigma factor (sigma-70 family)